MVELREVEDEFFKTPQAGPDEDEGDYTDTDSEISVDSQFDPSSESLLERISALRDIIPPQTRFWFYGKYQAARRFGAISLVFLGRAAWHVTVTALIIGVPFAISYSEEQQVQAMEQEQRMREVGGELLTAGSGQIGEGKEGGNTAAQVGAALGGGAAGGAARPAL